MKPNLFKQGMFQIDQSTTPDQLAKKREILAGIVKGGYGNARYTGQGLAHMLTGIVEGANEYKTGKFETQKRQEAEGMVSDGFGAQVNDLMKTLANPWLTPEQKQVVAMQLGQAQQLVAKQEAAQRAAAAQGQAQAATGAATGMFDSLFSGQAASAGRAPPPQGIAPSRTDMLNSVPLSAPIDEANPMDARIFGGQGLDTLSGGAGDDMLMGGSGMLGGAPGSDVLTGGENSDVLDGNPAPAQAPPLAGMVAPPPARTTNIAPQGFALDPGAVGGLLANQRPQQAPQRAPQVDPLLGPDLPTWAQYQGPGSREIMGFLSQKGVSPQQRAVAEAKLKEALQWEDPRQRAMMQREFNMQSGLLPGADRETEVVDGYGLIDTNTGELISPLANNGPAKPDPKDVAGLRKEFTGLQPAKDFETQAAAFARILASAKNPSPAGDLSLIFQYMKILDPSSVVRESEFALAANAGDYGERIQSMVNRITNGQTLSANIRADFVKSASELYDTGEKRFKSISEQYGERADRLGYNRADVMNDYRYRSDLAPETSSVRPRMPMTPPSVFGPQSAPSPAPPRRSMTWTGPDLSEFQKMDQMTRESVLSAYDVTAIPTDIGKFYLESIDGNR